ncbi:MAG: winged helix-turn-helix domain-containing protein [Planctomycetota bacterium]
MPAKSSATPDAGKPPAASAVKAPWTFLTNHSHVLICLWRRPDARLRDVAEMVGITERAVQAIVADLEDADVLTRTKRGRRNHYTLHEDAPLRHPVESAHRIGELLNLVGRDEPPPTDDD